MWMDNRKKSFVIYGTLSNGLIGLHTTWIAKKFIDCNLC